MLRLIKDRIRFFAKSRALRRGLREGYGKALLLALAASTLLSACGGGSSSNSANSLMVSGNWQFTVAPPADGSFLGGLQGGFLVQNGGSVTGAAAYAVSLPQFLIPCSTGSAAITGTVNGQSVSFTATAGTQKFTFTGTLSLDGSTMTGTYASTAGTAGDGAPCGSAQAGLQWSAILVPTITGTIQGSFHSTSASSGLDNQDFAVTGNLLQGANTGASNAPVTGTLTFVNPGSNLSDYPCLSTASVVGQISGNAVVLQILGSDGSSVGQIGEALPSLTGVNPVTFNSVQGGYILQGIGPAYMLATSSCPGKLTSTAVAGDYGDLCLALAPLGTPNACQQPITLTPVALTFPAQTEGTTSTQTVTLTNSSSAALSGLVLKLANIPASATNFAETDTCGLAGTSSLGAPFILAPGQACVITVSFTPQCPSQCGSALGATLTVTSPVSVDNDTAFAIPISGSATGSGEAARSQKVIDEKLVLEVSRLFAHSPTAARLRSLSNCNLQDEETSCGD
jgi:hypothetical protein